MLSSTEPLKITLVWTDAPASPGSASPVLNNLNLKVTAPPVGRSPAKVYIGNHFTQTDQLESTGESKPIAPGITAEALKDLYDKVNNVEMVILAAPAIGEYAIEVHVAKMGASKRHSVTKTDSVGYAVVASGAIDDQVTASRPGAGLTMALTAEGIALEFGRALAPLRERLATPRTRCRCSRRSGCRCPPDVAGEIQDCARARGRSSARSVR